MTFWISSLLNFVSNFVFLPNFNARTNFYCACIYFIIRVPWHLTDHINLCMTCKHNSRTFGHEVQIVTTYLLICTYLSSYKSIIFLYFWQMHHTHTQIHIESLRHENDNWEWFQDKLFFFKERYCALLFFLSFKQQGLWNVEMSSSNLLFIVEIFSLQAIIFLLTFSSQGSFNNYVDKMRAQCVELKLRWQICGHASTQ